MSSEVIIALISAVSAVVVAIIGKQWMTAGKKLSKDLNNLKDNKQILDLREKKKKAFDEREEAYNELTVRIAQHLLRGTDISTIESKLIECAEEDEKYRDATSDYIKEIERWMKE